MNTSDIKILTNRISHPLSGETIGEISDKFTYYFTYKDGLPEGEQLYWHPNGQLFYKKFYKEGKLEGEQLDYYDNGQLMLKQFYKKGKLEGEQLQWLKNGKTFKKFFKEGTRV